MHCTGIYFSDSVLWYFRDCIHKQNTQDNWKHGGREDLKETTVPCLYNRNWLTGYRRHCPSCYRSYWSLPWHPQLLSMLLFLPARMAPQCYLPPIWRHSLALVILRPIHVYPPFRPPRQWLTSLATTDQIIQDNCYRWKIARNIIAHAHVRIFILFQLAIASPSF